METPKAYTVRTETGEIRLMTQEEVGALVRTSLRQQQHHRKTSPTAPSPRGSSAKKKALVMSKRANNNNNANGPTETTTTTSPASRFQFPATSRRLSRHTWSSRRRQQQQQPQPNQHSYGNTTDTNNDDNNNHVSSPEREDEEERAASAPVPHTTTTALSPTETSAFRTTQDGNSLRISTINNAESERESRHEKSTTRAGNSPSKMLTSTDERFTAMVTRSFPIKTEKEGLQNMSETEINDLVRNSIQRARRQLQQQFTSSSPVSPPLLSPRLRKFSWSFDNNETEDPEERDDSCTPKEEGISDVDKSHDRSSNKLASQQPSQQDAIKEGVSLNCIASSTDAPVSPTSNVLEEGSTGDTGAIPESMASSPLLSDKEISQMVEKTMEKPIATVEGPVWEVTDIVQDTMRRASALALANQPSSSSNEAKSAEKKGQHSENGGSCGIECSLSGKIHTASTTLASSSSASAASLSHSSQTKETNEEDAKQEQTLSSPVEGKQSEKSNHPVSATHSEGKQDAKENNLITKEWNITIVSGGKDVAGSEGDFPEDEDGASLGKRRKHNNEHQSHCKIDSIASKGDKSTDAKCPPSENAREDLVEQDNSKVYPEEKTSKDSLAIKNAEQSKESEGKPDAIPDCLSDPEAYTLAEQSPDLFRRSKALALAKSSIAFTSLILSQKAGASANQKKEELTSHVSLTVDTNEQTSSATSDSSPTKDYPLSVDKPTASEIDPESWEPLIPTSDGVKCVEKEKTSMDNKVTTHPDAEKCDSEKKTPRWQNGRLVKRNFAEESKRKQVTTRILSILASEVSPSAESKKKLKSRRFRRAKYASKPIGSGPRKSKSEKDVPEKISTNSGSMVITDEFLAEIATKKGSTISPEELSQMIHTATKSHHTASSTEEDGEEAEEAEETTTIGGTTDTATFPTVSISKAEVEMQLTKSASSMREIPSKTKSSEDPLLPTKTGFCMDCLDLLGFVDDDDPCFLDEEDFSRNETTWEDDETTIIDQTEDENAGETTDVENGGVEVTDHGDDDEAEFDEAGTAILTLTSHERRRVTFSFSDGHQTMTMTDYDASSSDDSTAHSGFE